MQSKFSIKNDWWELTFAKFMCWNLGSIRSTTLVIGTYKKVAINEDASHILYYF